MPSIFKKTRSNILIFLNPMFRINSVKFPVRPKGFCEIFLPKCNMEYESFEGSVMWVLHIESAGNIRVEVCNKNVNYF